MNNEQTQKDQDSRKILTMIVLIATLMVCTTGATYAYFAISAVATNNITGTAATASLEFNSVCDGSGTSTTPSLIAPTNTTYTAKPMVPQYAYNASTNVLQKALTGATDKCVDANGNVVCKAYTFTIKNCSTATAVIKGQVKFTNPTTNLKWKLMTSATAVSVTSATDFTSATTSFANFATSVSLAPSETKQYWMIFWINETGAEQTDSGTWYATIQFINNTDGSGITSTITS